MPNGTRADKALVFLLRLVGVSSLLALAAVFMPVSWMVATHRWLGLGEMPVTPVVEYLARSLSACYALLVLSCWWSRPIWSATGPLCASWRWPSS